MKHPKPTPQGHVLLTLSTCPCDPRSDRQCPVCDGGLGVCANCGAAESQLDDECPKRPARDPGPALMCWALFALVLAIAAIYAAIQAFAR